MPQALLSKHPKVLLIAFGLTPIDGRMSLARPPASGGDYHL